MQRRILSSLLICLACMLLLAMRAQRTMAQEPYPAPWSPYVSDYANVIDSDGEAQMSAQLEALEQEHGIEVTVLTIQSIDSYNTGDATIESFATGLFNQWGIGDEETDNGVLILVAVQDRAVRIELGSGYDVRYDRVMNEILEEEMLPSFRRERYDRGILDGLHAVVETVTQETSGGVDSAATGSALQQDDPLIGQLRSRLEIERLSKTMESLISGSVSAWSRNILIGISVIVAALGSAGFYAARRYLRYRTRFCPNCQTRMQRLGEESDDVYLDSGQKTEEFLNSVEYDVWRCPACEAHSVYPYTNFFKRLARCPACRYRTLSASDEILERPTENSSGRKRVTSTCHHCDHRLSQIVILPRIQRNDDSGSAWSSSGSGSFGGGRSSGGGASGSW